MIYNTLQELLDAINAIQTQNQGLPSKEIRATQEALADKNIHLIPTNLDEINRLLTQVPFFSEQQAWGSSFLNLFRTKGCELLLADIDRKKNSNDKAEKAIRCSELFIFSDGHFFLETLKRLEQADRYDFVVHVFRLDSAQKELSEVNNLWSIIFLLDAVPFLLKANQPEFVKLLDDKLSKLRFGHDTFGTLARGANFSWPAPSPEYLIAALYAVTDPDARLPFAKNIITNPSSNYSLYAKPSIAVLVKILMMLDSKSHQDFIDFYLKTIPLTAEEIQEARQINTDKINSILFNNITTQETIDPSSQQDVALAIRSTFSNLPQTYMIPGFNDRTDITGTQPQQQPIHDIIKTLNACDDAAVFGNLSLSTIMDSKNSDDEYMKKNLQQLLDEMDDACSHLKNPATYTKAAQEAPKIFRALINKIDFNNFNLIQAILTEKNHGTKKRWNLEFVRFLSIKAADFYLAKLSFLDKPAEKVKFAKDHANVLIWTDPSFFLKATALLPKDNQLEFIQHTFQIGFNELSGCDDPSSIAGCLNAVADLEPNTQAQAVQTFKKATRNIKWDEIIKQALQNQTLPQTLYPHYLTGLLYLVVNPKERLILAKLILTAPPSTEIQYGFKDKPSIDFLQTVLKALPPEHKKLYIEYFNQTMEPVLTAWEKMEIQKLLGTAMQNPVIHTAPSAVNPNTAAAAAAIPNSAVIKMPAPGTPQQPDNPLKAELLTTLQAYVKERKATWKYRWSDSKFHSWLAPLFNFLFKRHKKVNKVEEQIKLLSSSQEIETSLQNILNILTHKTNPQLTLQIGPIFKEFSKGLLEEKLTNAFIEVTPDKPKPQLRV